MASSNMKINWKRVKLSHMFIGLPLLAMLLLYSMTGTSIAEEWDSLKVAAEIRELTGAQTRIVWLRDGSDDPRPWGGGPKTWIMGLDTDDGKGIRPIFPEPSTYSWVYFMPDGQGLVFTKKIDDTNVVHYVNWDGTGLRRLVPNAWLAGVSQDSDTGHVWLYCQDGGSVRRHRFDDARISEIVWDKNQTIGRFTISSDGKLGSGVYDNPGTGPCGVFELPNKAWHNIARGCQPAMLPGNDPYRFWVFHGDHRSGSIYTNPTDPERRTRTQLSLGNAPGTQGRHEVSYPKWSNNVRFMVLSAPFTSRQNEDGIPFPGGEGGQEKYKRYYDKVEISIGKLSEDLGRIEKWVQITKDNRGNYLPEAWVNPGKGTAPQAQTPATATEPGSRAAAWPSDSTALAFLWENSDAQNQVTDRAGQSRMCNPQARDRAIIGRFKEMELAGGSFTESAESVAGLLDSVRRANSITLEAIVTPHRNDLETPTAIISYGGPENHNLTLGMIGNRLFLNIRTSRQAESRVMLGTLKQGEPQHVVITYDPGHVVCYVDGRTTAADLTIAGDLYVWAAAPIFFGDNYARNQDWHGTLEGVALYGRKLDVREVRANAAAYRARLEAHKPATRIVIDARLEEVTPNSTPDAIAPYRRVLLVDSYEVLNVIEGELADKQIAVARWGILDNNILPLTREKGATHRLVLEPVTEHPQFESELTLNATDDITLPVHYNVQSRAKE